MNALTLTAAQWTDNGIAVIPIAYRDKRPTVPTWREFQQRLPTAAEIGRWFQDRFHNLAIVTGWQGLAVLDFDQRPLYELWRDWSRTAAPRARFSYTVQTSRGIHVYLFIDEPVQSSKAGAIDIKAAGGYVLAPPSIHPSGRAYKLLSDAPIVRVGRLADVLPAGLLVAPAPAAPRIEWAATPAANPWQAAMTPAQIDGDSAIAAIKARHSLFELFPGATRRGSRYVARCPLHDDHDPSVTISDDGGNARCWVGCLSGDFLDWYAAMQHIDLKAAIQELN